MRDTLCSYYTNSEDITSYMAGKLNINDADIVLEPSAGEGIFIDEMLRTHRSIKIDALDIDKGAISVLKKKYRDVHGVSVMETDTLMDGQLDLFAAVGGHYDKVIGNPPYGAWQDYERRGLLKKKYFGHYVKETYSLFLLRCLSVLKLHGKLSFIIPDTFLYLNMHSQLRETLLTQSKIEEILIFPSKFFPGVSFGYSNLSIITLERCDKAEASDNVVRVIKGFKTSEEFAALSCENLPIHLEVYKLRQKVLFANPQHRFMLADDMMGTILRNAPCTLGDVADVVTGFYTGDNLTFIKVLDKNVKGAGKYGTINASQVFECRSVDGIEGIEEGYVPYIKSASMTRYVRVNDEWFVRWDKGTVRFYNKNRKSRFQNSEYYFKTGIGVPMVKSSTIRACLMEGRVFDQSIVGIFPKDGSKLYYLLALMNSEIINKIVHLINPTANNSSNYIKLIPYIEPDEALYERVVLMIKTILDMKNQRNENEIMLYHDEINKIIGETYLKAAG